MALDSQYGGKKMYTVRYQDYVIVSNLNSIHISLVPSPFLRVLSAPSERKVRLKPRERGWGRDYIHITRCDNYYVLLNLISLNATHLLQITWNN